MISSLELARLCGVSQGTVDRAMHDRPGISPATKVRILKTAVQHGYAPHPAARELLTGERKTLGAVMPAGNSIFFMDLLNSIREAVCADGYRLFIVQTHDAGECVAALEDFAARRARLAFVVPPHGGLCLPPHVSHEMEVVSLINPFDGATVSLIPDERHTGRLGTEYLQAKGHTRIAHLTYASGDAAVEARSEGYRAAMLDRSLAPLVTTEWEVPALKRMVKGDGVSAFFCHNDWLALRVIRALLRLGLRVPEDVSVLGVDDSPTFVSLCPDITTLHYPSESIGQALRGHLNGLPLPTIDPVYVVERGTVT